MKKIALKLFAVSVIALGMTLTSCDPEDDPITPTGGTEEHDPGTGGEEPSTINYVSLESSPATITEGDYYDINFFGGDAEFEIQNYGSMESFIALFVKNSGIVCTQGDYRGMVTPLEAGSEIGSASNFTTSNGDAVFTVLYEEGDYEVWSGKTAYIGFCVENPSASGSRHYGWMKLGVTVSGGAPVFTLYGYAYEETAGKAIKAGATK